jgi:hypothetical protein
MDDDVVMPRSVRTTAMDAVENCVVASTGQREAQFLRLRAQIKAPAVVEIRKLEFEGTPHGIVALGIGWHLHQRSDQA